MTYEGSHGASARYTFSGLVEISRSSAMYAIAGTQTPSVKMADATMQTSDRPLIDAKSEAFVRSQNAEVISTTCQATDGKRWNVEVGGVAVRVKGEFMWSLK